MCIHKYSIRVVQERPSSFFFFRTKKMVLVIRVMMWQVKSLCLKIVLKEKIHKKGENSDCVYTHQKLNAFQHYMLVSVIVVSQPRLQQQNCNFKFSLFSNIFLDIFLHLIGYWKRSSHVIRLQRFLHTMRAIQGALIVASSIQIILGYSQIWGLLSRYIFQMK